MLAMPIEENGRADFYFPKNWDLESRIDRDTAGPSRAAVVLCEKVGGSIYRPGQIAGLDTLSPIGAPSPFRGPPCRQIIQARNNPDISIICGGGFILKLLTALDTSLPQITRFLHICAPVFIRRAAVEAPFALPPASPQSYYLLPIYLILL
jgi:hypothetical protein